VDFPYYNLTNGWGLHAEFGQRLAQTPRFHPRHQG
jgi:hypothetical protein